MSNYIGPEAIIEKKKKYIMPCLAHFYKEPRQMVKGSMQYLFDSEGRKYLDCFAGVSVINCGHCNPEINARVCEQVNTRYPQVSGLQPSIYISKPSAGAGIL